MNRLLKLTLAGALTGLLLSSIGSAGGPRTPSPRPPKPRGQVYEYRTYCGGWTVRANPEPSEPDTRPLVWVLDGAGDLKGCSNGLSYANLLAGSTVEMSVFAWSHGHRRLYLDQTDGDHAKAQGRRLAAAIQERKAREPGRRVVVVGHSAGSAVALAAAECLPPDSLDRMILLAPSVSTGYDLRPALRSAREGIDVFCSRKDRVALGVAVRLVGTTDNFWSGSAAGRWGFQPKRGGALDPFECARLRQHFWTAELAWTGHDGGHYGTHAPGFVHAYLFPLFGAPVK
jgi:hypothetical protein